MNLQTTWKPALLTAVAAGFALGGCKGREVVEPSAFADPSQAVMREFAANAVERPWAGTKRELKPFTKEELIRHAGLAFSSRGNPFALFGEEMQYQQGVRYELILGQLPGYALVVEPPVEAPPPELKEPEPQPYRRLSGVYFGDTVTAILEMGDGTPAQIVSPGQRVGQTEWYVESIDAEKLILVRYNNKDPKRVIVRLEVPPLFAPSGGGGGGGGGNRGGGGPGGKLGGGGGRD